MSKTVGDFPIGSVVKTPEGHAVVLDNNPGIMHEGDECLFVLPSGAGVRGGMAHDGKVVKIKDCEIVATSLENLMWLQREAKKEQEKDWEAYKQGITDVAVDMLKNGLLTHEAQIAHLLHEAGCPPMRRRFSAILTVEVEVEFDAVGHNEPLSVNDVTPTLIGNSFTVEDGEDRVLEIRADADLDKLYLVGSVVTAKNVEVKA